ncbi:TetR/AcrR family transcriptional regulator [Candidatus Cloacimonadota bacterium]
MVSSELHEMQMRVKRNYVAGIARELFFSRGYENTSIDEIARTAQMSKSTLYNYVKGKEDLFILVHLEGMKLRVGQLKTEMNSKTSGYEKILAFGSVYYSFYKENPGYFKLHMYEDYNSINKAKVDERIFNEFDDLLTEVIEMVRSAFRLGIQDGSLKDNLDVEYCDKYLAYNLRTILNVAFSPEKIKQLDANFNEEDFYFKYLEMFMQFIKK